MLLNVFLSLTLAAAILLLLVGLCFGRRRVERLKWCSMAAYVCAFFCFLLAVNMFNRFYIEGSAEILLRFSDLPIIARGRIGLMPPILAIFILGLRNRPAFATIREGAVFFALGMILMGGSLISLDLTLALKPEWSDQVLYAVGPMTLLSIVSTGVGMLKTGRTLRSRQESLLNEV